MDAHRIERTDRAFPGILRDRLGVDTPACLYAMGDPALLGARLLGFVCSIQCPGSVIIKTFDAIRHLRDSGVTVIGGFHSPMERESLDILLRGDQPVILCLAKRLTGIRLGQQARQAVKDGRMLLLSPFDENVRRTRAAQAVKRNELVAALADAILVPHAAPGGRTWAIVSAALAREQSVFTFDVEDNKALLAAGARPFVGLAITALTQGTPIAVRWELPR